MNFIDFLDLTAILAILGFIALFGIVCLAGVWLADNTNFLPDVKTPRLFWLLLLNFLLIAVIYFLAPQQLPVTLYKLSLVTLAGNVGYWIDRAIFPYARPDALMDMGLNPSFNASLIRRAIIVGCAMLAMGLGA